MKRNHFRHLLSLAIIVAFFFLATGSAVNKIHMNAFNYANKVEQPEEDDIYLVLNNGEKIKGDKINWKSGIIIKDQIQIDDKKFAIKDVKGYRQGDQYCSRIRNEYIKRIVHGPRINIYVRFYLVTTQSRSASGYMLTKTETRTEHYAQKGEDGPLVVFGSQKTIMELVAGCPSAIALANKSDRDIRKSIKANPNYLNNIFEVYNHECRD